ncbi:hypothetical protein BCR44DRAFT_1440347, partial [Catenaria anguillulae PL171]
MDRVQTQRIEQMAAVTEQSKAFQTNLDTIRESHLLKPLDEQAQAALIADVERMFKETMDNPRVRDL